MAIPVKVNEEEVGTAEIPVPAWIWAGVIIGILAVIIAIISLTRR